MSICSMPSSDSVRESRESLLWVGELTGVFTNDNLDGSWVTLQMIKKK